VIPPLIGAPLYRYAVRTVPVEDLQPETPSFREAEKALNNAGKVLANGDNY
jgi:hypothetical protein